MHFVYQKSTEVSVNAFQGTLATLQLHVTRVCLIFKSKIWFNVLFTLNSEFVESVTLPPIVSGCLSNNDCPDYTACQSRKCINPCAAPNVCAPNANCRVTRHQAVCTCPNGYIGSPEISCSLRKLAETKCISIIMFRSISRY